MKAVSEEDEDLCVLFFGADDHVEDFLVHLDVGLFCLYLFANFYWRGLYYDLLLDYFGFGV